MKKTLVALAALAATGAFAQSSVTLYGIVDLGYTSDKSTTVGGTADKKTTGIGEGTMAGNRIGFRGTEDLGGGMKASFTVEQGISLTSGDLFGNRAGASGHQDNAGTPAAGTGGLYTGAGAYTSSTNRQSFVSLSGGFGDVRVGYQYTNLYVLSSLSGYIVGPEASGGDQAHTWGNAAIAGYGQTVNAGGTRANGLTYISPVFGGGFKATVQYGSGRAGGAWDTSSPLTATNSAAKRTGYMVSYANGPLNAAVAYTSNKVTTAGATNVTQTHKLTQLAGSYDFGVAKLVGTYNSGKDGAVTSTDSKSHQIGVNVPFGGVEVFAAMGKAKSTKNDATGLTADVKQTQFGAKYALSKRTYAFFVNGTTKDAVAERAATGTAYKGTSTRIGVNHSF